MSCTRVKLNYVRVVHKVVKKYDTICRYADAIALHFLQPELVYISALSKTYRMYDGIMIDSRYVAPIPNIPILCS